MSDDPAVTLDNCAREPIHVPGHIQPHGVLLAFDGDAQVVAWSANAAGLIGVEPQQGQSLETLPLPVAVRDAVMQCVAEATADDAAPIALEAQLGPQVVDVVVHAYRARVLLELERREVSSDEVARFALQAHRGVERLKRQRTLDALLQLAVTELRALTGFDRVMAYRFRHDDSGDVVAESVRDDWDPFLGRRYPASDIPAQARRLYTLNTLRLIADVGYQPVPMVGRAGDEPLDMSFAVLRSVSPIHVEYLRNLGVGASMSVSIVVQDRLWGMLACHHHGPRLVPHSIRMACDVMAQVLAITVQSLDARERAEHARRSAELATTLVAAQLQDDDPLRALHLHADALRDLLGADAVVLAQQGRVLAGAEAPPDALVAATLQELTSSADDLVSRHAAPQWPAAMLSQLEPWAGLLALRFDPGLHGWLLAFRREQIETVRWGGRPEKEVVPGPLGPRLTPRGSFDEWRETVRGTAVPWEAARLDSAQSLLAALHRASHTRAAEVERARTQMLAILGHDLRDPLHSITMAAKVLEQDDHPQHAMGQRIRASSGRMQRMISHILDLSRLRSGLGLGLRPVPVDLAQLLSDLVDEARVAYPGVSYRATVPAMLPSVADPDRLAQAVANLLSNARHHGSAGHDIAIDLRGGDDAVWLEVRNTAQPIPPPMQAQLFSPFKRREAALPGAHSGLGLGLYIAHAIVGAHGGDLSYAYEPPEVVFRIRLPAMPGSDAVIAPGAAAGSRLSVLVVDDHLDSAELLSQVLIMEQFESGSASDSDTALRLAETRPWSAIVLDVQMPGRSGVELATHWRAQLKPLPLLVALTGLASAEAQLAGGPFDAVLTKPVDVDALIALLHGRATRPTHG